MLSQRLRRSFCAEQGGAHADGKNILASTVLLMRRNTRRYGGYIIHFGIVVMFIGIAGGAFNQSRSRRWATAMR